jgi:hypothetical protein
LFEYECSLRYYIKIKNESRLTCVQKETQEELEDVDAKKWKLDTERDASGFDEGYYGIYWKRLGKRVHTY